MGPGPGVVREIDGTPACAGDPADGSEMFSCGQPATVILTQLRPGYTMQNTDSAAPFLVVIGVCRQHIRPVREWLEASWPHDAVDACGVAFWAAHLETFHDMLGVDVPVLQMVRAG
jgi:hypothetical protein